MPDDVASNVVLLYAIVYPLTYDPNGWTYLTWMGLGIVVGIFLLLSAMND